MMAADGRGTPEIIQKIRGWSHEEWKQEAAELRSRGWITSDGQHTPLGRSVRRGVELATDQNAQAIVVNLGDERSGKVLEVLEQVAAFLIETGVVPGTWPPKHLGQMGSA
jgi:CTP:molybdopterin cytidylyltransferase MocA